jgi:cytochrome c-type biogenesis protein CcmH/NrfG
LVVGYFVGAGHVFESTPAAPPVAAAPADPGGIPGGLGQLQTQQRIQTEETALTQDPGNVQGWINLGNDYFDLHLAQQAVTAYGKALALAPKLPFAPDVLTDQGVMYRELKEYDKAIANFKQAGKLNPQHIQSLYNLGIVYAQDKHNQPEAIKAWKRVIEIAPASPQAELARKAIAMPGN